MRTLYAAAAYFGLVFALGFALGVLRNTAQSLMPALTRLEAVLIELPMMLAASWLICAGVVRRFSVPATIGARGIMGVAAFGLLELAEFGVALYVLGLTPAEHLRSYGELSHALGLLAQIAFALFPLLRLLGRQK